MKRILFVFLMAGLWASCGQKTEEAKPQYKDITEMVFASGVLDPYNKYNLTAQTEGYLTALNFKEGDVVKEGDVLAEIDNAQNTFNEKSSAELLAISRENLSDQAPALKQTEANIELAKEKVKQDEQQVARYKKLAETNSVSKLELENVQLALENSKTNLTNLRETYRLQKLQAQQQFISQEAQKNINSVFSGNNKIKAVVGGKIYRKLKEVGDYIRRGEIIAVIGDPEQLHARLNIDESNISKIKKGQKVMVQLNTSKGVNNEGVVEEILPAFEEMSQSFICKVRFVKAPDISIMGTQLQANIIIGTRNRVFVIPRAYLDFGNKVIVKGKDMPVEIKTGFISNDWVEVISGLKEEDVLILQKR